MKEFFEKRFKLQEHETNIRTELLAGLTTFMTMAYILAVNPNILSITGMDKGAVFTATALSAFIATMFMGFAANLPFLLAPGMGLNAYFTFTVVLGMNLPWSVALTAVFVEGLIFIALSVTNVREAIFNAIPMSLKTAVSVGIGLFIALIGLKTANIVMPDKATLVKLFPFKEIQSIQIKIGDNQFVSASFNDYGITTILAIIGILITAIMVAKKIKGAILYGILITWLLGIICELSGIYIPINAPDSGFYSLIPSFAGGFHVPSVAPIFMKFEFDKILTFDFWAIVCSFLFVDLFDTIGTLVGVSTKANLLDENGRLPGIKGALLSDAIGTTVGACLGTSTVTTFVESASGVTAGGRTGLTAVAGAILFAIALILSPIFLAIPAFATAPALVVVGFYMFTSVAKIDFNDFTECIPAYICILAMPFFYSIAEGISMGIVSYVIINLFTGNRKKISILMYALAILFILRYIPFGL